MKLSKKAQKMWDNLGEAYENHVNISYDGTVDERRDAACAYLAACKKLHNYIVRLEDKAWKYNDLSK